MTVPRTIQRIEADRQRIERDGSRLAASLGRTAFRHAAAAIRLGHDPVDASRDVLLGNGRIGQAGLAPILSRTMLLAHLRGRRRTMLEAAPKIGRQPTLDLSASQAEIEKRRRREEELLAALLLLSGDEIAALWRKYDQQAQSLAGYIVRPLLDRVQEAAKRAAALPTPTFEDRFPKIPTEPQHPNIPAEIKEVGEEYAKAGFVPGYSHSLDTAVSTSAVNAYESGRRDGWKQPRVREQLWGFRYSAILDARTTALCRGLNGMVAPVDDPAWGQWTPPNHWNCRSVLVEVWESSALAHKPDVIQPTATADEMEKFYDFKRKFLESN